MKSATLIVLCALIAFVAAAPQPQRGWGRGVGEPSFGRRDDRNQDRFGGIQGDGPRHGQEHERRDVRNHGGFNGRFDRRQGYGQGHGQRHGHGFDHGHGHRNGHGNGQGHGHGQGHEHGCRRRTTALPIESTPVVISTTGLPPTTSISSVPTGSTTVFTNAASSVTVSGTTALPAVSDSSQAPDVPVTSRF